MTPFLNQMSAGAVLPAAWMAEMSARMGSAWAAQAAQWMGAPDAAAGEELPDAAPAELAPVGGRLTAADEVVAAVAAEAPDVEQDVSAMVDAIVDGPVDGGIAPDAGFDPARLN
ncbi:hypothetical protein JQC91_05320 [Jannaschia sp. Os4]|uniref:hypothetical protein n=1 Tax=Jannaschia sp. Os4 TaxID=2807617 RepID=UPI00193A71BD|nr:hypothetical protein [Jannaschia sp. Os4]MBM2575719.1 hypothetical protein [Jannaschia sp. Os4]